MEGINYHWSRCTEHAVAKNVEINSEKYECYTSAVNSKENSMNPVSLIYNTNNEWGRSGNPGILAKVFYNVGYIEYSNNWGYQDEASEDDEFKETSAHEIGHEILRNYGGMIYSWQHKGSSYLLPQDKKPTKDNDKSVIVIKNYTHIDNYPSSFGEYYPTTGEIDLMKYYHSLSPENKIIAYPDSSRTVASEKDILGLLWLSKIEIK